MHEHLSPFKQLARFACALTLALAPLSSQAQTKNAPAPATAASATTGNAADAAQEKPKADTATRARRVGTSAPATNDAARGEKKIASDGATTATGDKKSNAEKTTTAPKVATPKVETADEEIARRRSEIESAAPDESARLSRALVDRLVELNRRDEALEELRLLVHEDRIDPVFFYNTGNALARLGDANAAADAYRKAISQRKGNYARALNNLGVVLTRQGNWDEAYDTLNAALTQENFTYAEASYNLGRLHLLRGDANLAIREWTRTLSLNPDNAAAAAALARAYAEDGSQKRALAVLANFSARSARVGGGVPREIAQAREEINAGLESPDNARDARDAATPLTDGTSASVVGAAASASTPRTLAAMSSASTRKGARPFAVDPQTYDLLQSARAASDEGKFEEAARRYRSVLARNNGYLPPANLELATALINLKRDDEALAALAPVTERDDARYPVAHYHLARLYERRGQLELAARQFQRAAELYGDAAPQMYFDVSRVREKLNDQAGALAAMESYVASISRQGSVPDWATARVSALREKAKGATAAQTTAPPKP